MTGINGVGEIQVCSGSNGLQVDMKMPGSGNHTRRQARGRPADVNSPTLIGANDRLRGTPPCSCSRAVMVPAKRFAGNGVSNGMGI